jgi:actin
MLEIVFETLSTPAFYSCKDAVLVLYSTGKSTGLVVDSGYGRTNVVPIWQDFGLSVQTLKIDLAGRDMDNHLAEMLAERGYSFDSPAGRDIVRDIKEKMCYTALDFAQELQAPAQASPVKLYELPDGQTITLGNECFIVPEVLFDPSVLGSQSARLHRETFDAIMKCDFDIRKTFFGNIILVSFYHGFLIFYNAYSV